ncbi:MAG: ABC transporter permease [Flavobacteriales bacterium]
MERKNDKIKENNSHFGNEELDTESKSLYKVACNRLKRDKLALFGGFIIGVAFLIAILGSLIRPDPTKHSNNMIPSLRTLKPGSSVDILKVRINRKTEGKYFWEKLFFGGEAKKYKYFPINNFNFKQKDIIINKYTTKKGLEGEKIPFNIADVLYPIDIDNQYMKKDNKLEFHIIGDKKVTRSLQSMRKEIMEKNIINKTFWLGTDTHGRDLLSRLMAGTIVSLSVGFIAVIISLIIGVSLGSIAGYFKGLIDDLIMWLINVIWSIPTLLLIIAITFALGKGFSQVFIAVGLTMWVQVARIVRGEVLSVREKEFVEAGKALGYSSVRIITKHIIPNVMSPVIVISAANFASAILIEAGLSFLGIGAQIPIASWGSMIKNHYTYITTDYAYLAILPGMCIMLLVLAFMLVGNGLRDALDTKALDEYGGA